MQLCDKSYNSKHIFGVMATSNGTFTPIQDAIKSQGNATCLSFEDSIKFPGSATFTKPLLEPNTTTLTPKSSASTGVTKLRARPECRTVQVDPNSGCPEAAVKYSISLADFTKYNPRATFYKNLKPKQHVCCLAGTLPDFSPKPNSDGLCYIYQAQLNDNYDDLATEYSITKE